MNVSEAVEKITAIKKGDHDYMGSGIPLEEAIADILQELLDSGGVGSEYREVEDERD